MPPHRAPSADNSASQSPEQIAATIAEFLAEHAEAAVLEDGKVLFDLRTAKHSLSTEHGRCSLHLWNDERNVVRNIVAVDGACERSASLRPNDWVMRSRRRLNL